MSSLAIQDIKAGMIVVTPSSNLPNLTEDRKYVVLDVEGDWIQIQDDSGDIRYYQSFLFIEADVYYAMILYLSMLRIFDIDPKDLN